MPEVHDNIDGTHSVGNQTLNLESSILNSTNTEDDGISNNMAQLAYYATFIVIFQFGWASTQIAHLAAIPGAKYLGFFSSHSLKTREKYISFAQFVHFLREVCLLFNF